MKHSDVMSIPMIAERSGVTAHAVRKWIKLLDFPTPTGYLSQVTSGPGSLPWWDWAVVEEWLDEHPRLGRRDVNELG